MKKLKVQTFKQFKDKVLDTPEKKRDYKKFYTLFDGQIENEYLEELGQKVRRTRQIVGLTQDELAKRVRTNKSTISRLENGNQNLTTKTLLRIATALGGELEIKIR